MALARLDFVPFLSAIPGELAFVALRGLFEFWVIRPEARARWHWIIMREGTAVAMREGLSRRRAFETLDIFVSNREHHRAPRRRAAELKEARRRAAEAAAAKQIADEHARRHLPITRNAIVWLLRYGDDLSLQAVGDLVDLSPERVRQICKKTEARAFWRAAQDRGNSRPFLRRLRAAGCFVGTRNPDAAG